MRDIASEGIGAPVIREYSSKSRGETGIIKNHDIYRVNFKFYTFVPLERLKNPQIWEKKIGGVRPALNKTLHCNKKKNI